MTHTTWRPLRLPAAARRTWPGLLDNATIARHWLRDSLAGEDEQTIIIAEHVAAELVSNALRHTHSGLPGGRFSLSYKVGLETIDVGVTDEGALDSSAAAVEVPGPLAEGGRGLMMLECLGVSWTRQRLPAGQITRASFAR